jgi:hypothetical protein
MSSNDLIQRISQNINEYLKLTEERLKKYETFNLNIFS